MCVINFSCVLGVCALLRLLVIIVTCYRQYGKFSTAKCGQSVVIKMLMGCVYR